MEKTYHLDLKTLLEYLHGKSAVLRTSIVLPKMRQPCQGYIFLKNGQVLRSYVLDHAGTLLSEGPKANAQLSTTTEWRVQIESEQIVEQELVTLVQQYRIPSGLLSTGPAATAPHQRRPLDMAALQMFSPKQSLLLRTVFTLVNGERTVAQIKTQLNYPPNIIEETLEVLRSLGYIE